MRRAGATMRQAGATMHQAGATMHRSGVTMHQVAATMHRSGMTMHRSGVTMHRSGMTMHRSGVTMHRSGMTMHRGPTVSLFNGGRWCRPAHDTRLSWAILLSEERLAPAAPRQAPPAAPYAERVTSRARPMVRSPRSGRC
jgi:hypothetical protein